MTKILYAFPSLLKLHETEVSQCGRQEVAINKIVQLRKKEKENQRRIQELQKQIGKLKDILNSPLETEDQELLDAELVSSTHTAKAKGSITENHSRTMHAQSTRK